MTAPTRRWWRATSSPTMTAEERLWCLDGDAPTWAGLQFLSSGTATTGRRSPRPRSSASACPASRFSDGPRGAVVGNATCFPVSMARGRDVGSRARGARRRRDRPRAARRSGPNLTGAVCVNVLRHPAWGRAQETYGEDPHHVGELGAALTRGLQRHVMACVKHFACNSMENARFTVDIEVDEVALHEVYLPHFRRIVDEGVAVGDVGVQQRQRRVVRAEPGAAHRRAARRVGLRGLRHQRLDLRAARRGDVAARRARHRDAVPDGPRPAPAGRARARRRVVGRRRRARSTRIVATLLRFDDVLSAPDPRRRARLAEHRALAREVAARSVVLLRNEPVDGAPVLPLRRRRAASRCSAGSPTRSTSATAGRATCGTSTAAPSSTGCATRWRRRPRRRHRPRARRGGRRRRRRRGRGRRLHLPRRGRVHRRDRPVAARRCSPPPTSPTWSSASRRTLVDLPPTDEAGAARRRGRAGSASAATAPSLRLPDGRRRADPRRRRGQPAHGRRHPGRQRGRRRPSGSTPCPRSCRPGTAAARPAPVSPTCCSARSTRRPGCRSASRPTRTTSPVRPRRHARSATTAGTAGGTSRATAPRPRSRSASASSYTTFALARRRGRSPTTRRHRARRRARTPASATAPTSSRSTPRSPDPDAPPRLVGFARVEVSAGTTADVTIAVPLDRLATRDPEQHTWRPPSGGHRITVARCAGDPGGRHHDVTL